MCDPYQQVEAKYKLTHGAIGLISAYQKFSVSILTKNALVLRDLDLLEPIKERVDAGFTITTFNSDAQPFFEPRASPVKDRIDVLRRPNEAGVDTWVFIAPMLPYVTEVELEEGLNRLAESGVKRLITDRYKSRGMIINQTLKAYGIWKPTSDARGIRQLIWEGDKYYRTLDARISRMWKQTAPNAIHQKVY